MEGGRERAKNKRGKQKEAIKENDKTVRNLEGGTRGWWEEEHKARKK